jgi:hypothetical protein
MRWERAGNAPGMRRECAKIPLHELRMRLFRFFWPFGHQPAARALISTLRRSRRTARHSAESGLHWGKPSGGLPSPVVLLVHAIRGNQKKGLTGAKRDHGDSHRNLCSLCFLLFNFLRSGCRPGCVSSVTTGRPLKTESGMAAGTLCLCWIRGKVRGDACGERGDAFSENGEGGRETGERTNDGGKLAARRISVGG